MRTPRFAVGVALLIGVVAARGSSDPGLSLTIGRVNQNVVLEWFALNGVSYQLETSGNVTTWANSGPVRTGAGASVFVTNVIGVAGRVFYRVRRVAPGGNNSAVFNPVAGVLTIVGDDLDNLISVGRDGAGTILVNGGAMPITGGVPNVTNTFLIEVFGRDGHDQLTIDQSGGVMPPAHLFGEAGNDTLTGSSAADMLVGGSGNDTLIGRGGADAMYGEEDDDSFIWNPGDGSDLIEGGTGLDTLVFNGANISENFDLSAIGGRLRFFRNVANIFMDLDGVERVNLQALGGTDNIVVNSLYGTAVKEVNVDLAASGGGSDSSADTITVNGTADADKFTINAGIGGAVECSVLGTFIRMLHAETTNDALIINGVGGDVVTINGSAGADTMKVTADGTLARVDVTGFSGPVKVSGALTLVINGLDGPDTISCSGNLAAIVPLVLDGGPGNDTILGSNGPDTIYGGDGNDFIDGNQGNDTVFMGADDDTFQWDPGDGSDTVEGQAGTDTLIFNGANISENIDLSANGGRLRFTRNVANIVMDVNGVERINHQALGGADNIVINSLVGTSVTQVNIDLAASGGALGDGQPDTVTVNGTSGFDIIHVMENAGALDIAGLSAFIHITHAELTNDLVVVNARAGDDLVNINGSNAAEAMTLAASTNAAFARVTASGFPAIVDVSGAETVGLNVFGGADNVTMDNMAGTGVSRVDVDLAPVHGTADDLQPDVVTVNGTASADAINITANGSAIDVSGLSAFLHITGSQKVNDLLVVNGAGANDVLTVNGSEATDTIGITANGSAVRVDSSALPAALDVLSVPKLIVNALGGPDTISCAGNLAALTSLQLDGGEGDDTILGSNGADVIIGGPGKDFIDGNQGNDTVFMGEGDDTFNWDPGDGSDTVEGQGGFDTLIFNGANISEAFDFSANGGRLRFTRNVAAIVMDVNDVERVNLRALGGADTVAVNSLLATAVTEVNLDLAATGGGGDALVDTITINGTPGADTFNINANAGSVEVSGLGTLVRVTNGELTNDAINITGVGGDRVNVNGSSGADTMTVTANGTNWARVDATSYTIPVQVSGALTLIVNGLDGPDTISCVGNLAAIVPLQLDGGDGDDTILGSNGADIIIGGNGKDFIDGNQGNDTVFMGADDDTFQWDPGDGSDTVEGQGGVDTLLFNGANISEAFDLSANGTRLRFTRNVAAIVMDANEVERVSLQTLGGADTVVVNSLAGTAVTQVSIDLAATGGGGDALPGTVTVNGTAAPDSINISANAGVVEVSGLSALVRILRPEPANDSLIVNGLGGVDVFNVAPGVTALIMVTTNQ